MLTLEISAQRLRRAITAAETVTDEAVLKANAVMTELVTARLAFRNHEAAAHAQPALLSLQKATGDLISAHSGFLRAHAELRKGLNITMAPEEGDCPDWVVRANASDEQQAAA
ncbi:hypothetical protein [Alteriqipengyuania lutimaris]|uniref:hypothetical protein n=1 Tax=Alteriqipengyuania lutimaris TaxID=1538146 RepID=UPI001CFDF7EB|nr:hypothetical protein [Alteriqipengyuania lutimaris]